MKAKNAARAVADVTQGMVLATVDIAASPERVFKAISSSEIAKWWGTPELYRVTEWTGELKPGGRFKSSGVGADGMPFAVEGEFLEIDPPRRLVHTWQPGWEPGPPTTVTYRLEALDGGTRVTVRHDGFGDRAESCKSHGDGWVRVMGWLTGFVAPAPATLYFLCRLLPPRPTFMQDLTEPERDAMREHATYWGKHLEAGRAIVYGPVADPKAGYGMGIIAVESVEQARELEENDPAVKRIPGTRYERLPMPRVLY
jgi:uncharacterized protein YndB with AHSA1/START domain